MIEVVRRFVTHPEPLHDSPRTSMGHGCERYDFRQDEPVETVSEHRLRGAVKKIPIELNFIVLNQRYLAEGVGFEPTVPLRVRQFSRLEP